MNSRLVVMTALLAISLNSWCQATSYRPFRVDANVEIALPCWELLDASHLVIWITPGEDVVGPNDTDYGGKYSIGDSGSLVVNNTVKSDNGVYKCISKSPEGPYVTTKTELEVLDVSYVPEVDDWEKNLTRGLIAAASTAVFFIAACGFSSFNWNERHPKRRSSSPSIRRPSHPSSATSATSSDPSSLQELKGLDNPALSIDSNEIDSGL
ncbi:hypothetical protein DAPPUDRAFT_307321 [Daphnia pulex]|uniref:Ig-like domain-containing protein n=1 Tax=Daphnia pulex TaxID=6669 RepID=E9H1Q0_DAPPU|nr:hypothetical protein DAPPUDRAFT_307321 [Daphnia pulex]|eukprot:EFX74332.1 hypothetical protein DAPPUDRAFT_307321 [Daphnia pulex]